MASKSRARPERKKRNPTQFPELGIFDIPDLDTMNDSDGSEVDDSVLELELESLMSGKGPPSKRTRPKPKAKPVIDIEKLASDCLKDFDDDEEEDDNLSTDEDLLNELQGLNKNYSDEADLSEGKTEEKEDSETNIVASANFIGVLEERRTMYNEAIAAAKAAEDSSKLRRYGRALKTIESLFKAANSGASINEEDIPPIVKIPKVCVPNSAKNVSKPATNLDESNQSKDSTGNTDCTGEASYVEGSNNDSLLRTRRDQYRKAALMAKRSGNKELALQYLRTVKTFDSILEAMDKNLPVDLSKMPPPLEEFPDFVNSTSKITSEKVTRAETQTSSNTDIEKAALAAADDADQVEIFSAPPAPSTIMEALTQRLEKYVSTKESAEAEGNSGKVRRLERIIKQYEKSIKDYKSGKSNLDFSELPSPPGFGPIPVESGNPVSAKPVDQNPSNVKPVSTAPKQNPVSNNPVLQKPKIQRANTSTNKQLEFLLERQKLFRQAAIEAKKNGDIQQAKQHLKMSKGFDSMIEATKCGLPIDATSIPTPPQIESDFVIVDVSECNENEDRSSEELFEGLETDLLHQIEICSRNKEHFLRLGDVCSASKFEKLCLESKKDLAVILHLKKKGEQAPRFHYETRLFSVVLCNPDLSDNDIEVTVERGINLPGKPDDLDSYVRVEFPIPQEAPQRAKTHTVRDSNNPIYQEEFKFEFMRKSRSHLRSFKRSSMKLEVFSKGGFLRSDTHLGTVAIKLSELESKCIIHDSFNLMDGRKACGGKLEVKIRVRDPLLIKQVEEVREKWLVVGS